MKSELKMASKQWEREWERARECERETERWNGAPLPLTYLYALRTCRGYHCPPSPAAVEPHWQPLWGSGAWPPREALQGISFSLSSAVPCWIMRLPMVPSASLVPLISQSSRHRSHFVCPLWWCIVVVVCFIIIIVVVVVVVVIAIVVFILRIFHSFHSFGGQELEGEGGRKEGVLTK